MERSGNGEFINYVTQKGEGGGSPWCYTKAQRLYRGEEGGHIGVDQSVQSETAIMK